MQLPHVCLFTSTSLVQLAQYDVAVSVKPFLIYCYCDIMRWKHLPHISFNQFSFLYCLRCAVTENLPTIPPMEYNYSPYFPFLHSYFQRGQEFLKPGVMWLGPFNEITGIHILGVTSVLSPMLGPVIV